MRLEEKCYQVEAWTRSDAKFTGESKWILTI